MGLSLLRAASTTAQTLELKMNEYALSAFIFGLTAGFKPGPLGIVVIQQTLEHGLKHGIKASLAPVITDGPIILVSLLVLSQFKEVAPFIGILSFVGGFTRLLEILISLILKILKEIHNKYKPPTKLKIPMKGATSLN